jgi:hypothetical protein
MGGVPAKLTPRPAATLADAIPAHSRPAELPARRGGPAEADARRSRFASGDEANSRGMSGADEPLGFDEHIKPLFRERDRNSMRSRFDLWSLEDVSTHADAILNQLEAGTMPCDGAWPAERVDLLRRWIDAGKPA